MPAPSDRRRNTGFAFNRNSVRVPGQYAHGLEDPQPQPPLRAQQNYSSGWPQHQSSSGNSGNGHYLSQRGHSSKTSRDHRGSVAQQVHQKQTSKSYDILDKWFIHGINNRCTESVCDRCGAGGHTGDACPKNMMTCQYCDQEVHYSELCDHQLSCPHRTRYCHTCGHSFSLATFWTHSQACRVGYCKAERLPQGLRKDGMIGA